MGKSAARKGDRIVSSTPGDIHILMVPSPGGPVPTPFPHACSAVIKDKCIDSVKVHGKPAAVKGSIAHHSPPHVPNGPGPFQKPPANKGEIVTGSSSVFFGGKEAAMSGDTGKMCADPSDTPVGKVMGSGATVEIGGGSATGDADRAAAAAEAMRAASAACHTWINANMPPGAEREQAHRQLCTTTGHPIDVATGKLITRSVDLTLPGRIGFQFVRNYSSARLESGPFGFGWRHSYQIELIVTDEFVAHRDANGRMLAFEPVAIGGQTLNPVGDLTLRRTADSYWVENAGGQRQRFACASAARLPLAEIADDRGNSIQFTYERGFLTRIRDTAGRTIRLEYDERDHATRLWIEKPAAHGAIELRRYEYDAAGDLIAVRDAADQALRYEYAHHLLVRETDRIGYSFYFRYDPAGWCHETWGDGGVLARRVEYDRARRTTRVTHSDGHRRTYHWNEQGLVESEIDALGARWGTQYDEQQRIAAATDPLGGVMSFEYDVAGRLVARIDANGNVFAKSYDSQGRGEGIEDAAGGAWTSEYGPTGDLVARRDPDRNAAGFEWAENGDLVAVIDTVGGRTRHDYDAAGNRIRSESSNGRATTRRFDFLGRLVSEADELGERVAYEFDSLGRVSRARFRDRGEFHYEHDAEGNVTSVTDFAGHKTVLEYGRFNKLLRRLGPQTAAGAARAETRFEYDSENRLIAIVYPGGGRAEYEFDANGRVCAKQTADRLKFVYTRDAAGRIAEIHDDDGWFASYERDGNGQVVRRELADGDETRYTYDPRGRLIGASNADGRVAMEYDAYGRVVAESGPFGALCHEYDALGNVVKISFGDELECALNYGQGVIAVAGVAASVRAQHDHHGRLTDLALSNGGHETYSYGVSHRPESCARGGAVTRYGYDAARRLTSVELEDGVVERYERDAEGRLATVACESAATPAITHYRYDGDGNRSAGDVACRYDAGNRLQSCGSEKLRYDRRGRLVERVAANGGVCQYGYTVDGLLSEVVRADLRATYRYDALGRRIAKIVDGKETRFAWDGNRVCHEWRPDGEERNYTYRFESMSPLFMHRRVFGGDWEPFFFHNDHRGCPVALTDGAGREVWRARVGAFGVVENEVGVLDQPLALPGQYRDGETGLSYNFFRYYDPRLTSYITPDPVGHVGGQHLYAYVADPITEIDPLGLSSADYDHSQRTPHQVYVVIEDYGHEPGDFGKDSRYVEFEAKTGFAYANDHINLNGSGDPKKGSEEATAGIGPNGEVVVIEGRHRAVSSAANDPIEERLGGIPERPGHLRYPLARNAPIQAGDVGPSLGDMANDPDTLARARSGKRNP